MEVQPLDIPQSDIEVFEEYHEFCLWKKMKEFNDENKSTKVTITNVAKATKSCKRKASEPSLDGLEINVKKKKIQSNKKEKVIGIVDNSDKNLLSLIDNNQKKPASKDDSSDSSDDSDNTFYETNDPSIQYDTNTCKTTPAQLNEKIHTSIEENRRKENL